MFASTSPLASVGQPVGVPLGIQGNGGEERGPRQASPAEEVRARVAQVPRRRDAVYKETRLEVQDRERRRKERRATLAFPSLLRAEEDQGPGSHLLCGRGQEYSCLWLCGPQGCSGPGVGLPVLHIVPKLVLSACVVWGVVLVLSGEGC